MWPPFGLYGGCVCVWWCGWMRWVCMWWCWCWRDVDEGIVVFHARGQMSRVSQCSHAQGSQCCRFRFFVDIANTAVIGASPLENCLEIPFEGCVWCRSFLCYSHRLAHHHASLLTQRTRVNYTFICIIIWRDTKTTELYLVIACASYEDSVEIPMTGISASNSYYL